MSIKTRLTLLFTVFVSLLLFIAFVLIYTLAERYRKTEFYARIHAEAITSTELLFGKETLSPATFKLLDKNHLTVLNDEEIIIYDNRDSLLYESGEDFLSIDKNTLNRVRLEKEIRWREGDREIVGIQYSDKFNHFVVFGSAIDKYGYSKIKNLSFILIFGWLFGTLIFFAFGRIYAQRALLPIQNLILQIDKINTKQLNVRIEAENKEDELGQLTDRFNQMLDRIEDGFQIQRAFVSNASHELRTPLTAIKGQIQVALMDNDPQEWEETLKSVLEDVQQMNQLSNGLLTLAGLNMENEQQFVPVEMRKVYQQVYDEIIATKPNYNIEANWNTEQNITIIGIEALLKLAILNLIENGCKFSPNHSVSVSFESSKSILQVVFKNSGIPIPENELPDIFKPFKRGSNSHRVSGHGVGLSLTEKIIKLHKGSIDVESSIENGTIFTIQLPV